MEILPKPLNRKKFDAFVCVQLVAKLDVAIGAVIVGVALCIVLGELDNSSISSDRVIQTTSNHNKLPSVLNPAPCHQ